MMKPRRRGVRTRSQSECRHSRFPSQSVSEGTYRRSEFCRAARHVNTLLYILLLASLQPCDALGVAHTHTYNIYIYIYIYVGWGGVMGGWVGIYIYI